MKQPVKGHVQWLAREIQSKLSLVLVSIDRGPPASVMKANLDALKFCLGSPLVLFHAQLGSKLRWSLRRAL